MVPGGKSGGWRAEKNFAMLSTGAPDLCLGGVGSVLGILDLELCCVARPYSDSDRIFFAGGWELMFPLVPFCVTTVHHSKVILLYCRQWGAIKNLG